MPTKAIAGRALHQASLMQWIAVEAEHRQLDPGEVWLEAGAPDNSGCLGIDMTVFE